MSGCCCKGRAEGKHDLLCEQVLTAAFGSVGDAPDDVLALMRAKGRVILTSPEVPDDAPLGLVRQVFMETLEDHPQPQMSSQYDQDRSEAWSCADNCDTCWWLLTDEAEQELGDAVIALRLRAHLASGHTTTSEDVAEGEDMSDDTSRQMEENSRQDRRRAEAAQAASTELVGVELIVAYNHTKTDPSQMASYGHAVSTGYEFALERDGATFTVSVKRDSH